MLAGLVQAPSRLAPNRNPEAAEKRAQLVIAAMADQGLISQASAKTALVAPAERPSAIGAGSVNYAADYVMDVLDDFIGAIEGDVTVLTTIDTKLQSSAETILVEALAAQGAKLRASQGAVVSMATDGGIRALIGGRDYTKSQFNRATAAQAPAGLGIQALRLSHRDREGPDAGHDPRRVPGLDQGLGAGELFAQLSRPGHAADRAGAFAQHGRGAADPGGDAARGRPDGPAPRHQFGAATQSSLALGTSEVTPLELTAAYATFANGGQSRAALCDPAR
jgi:penicillin-binding protein 1A